MDVKEMTDAQLQAEREELVPQLNNFLWLVASREARAEIEPAVKRYKEIVIEQGRRRTNA